MPITLGKNIREWESEAELFYLFTLFFIRKADGLIVALSGNLERPLVGQGGTFLEPGSANLITFEVSTLPFYINAKVPSQMDVAPCC